ncbi:adenine phosphoribosyltransferase [Streptomyces calvus]
MALRCGAGCVPVRKAGKLPGETFSRAYELEYGTATLEIQRDAFRPEDRVVVVDDVLATGGTAEAAIELVHSTGARVTGVVVLMELTFLPGRERLERLVKSDCVQAAIAV